ncbi:MAG: tRNA threonylcarbamoyladenosine dehydratase [Raoultibacter sp.]
MVDQDAAARSKLLIGHDGLEKLARSTVVVLGLGGVGSSCVEALARGGVGNFVIVDHDVVAPSNINRQAIAFTSTLGQRKVDVMRAMIADINPAASVVAHPSFVLPENLPQFFDLPPDYVVDAIDTVATKLALAQFAEEHDFRLVSSMGSGNKFYPEQFRFADIYDTAVCPLCKVMRKEARARNIKALRVLYSPEAPVAVPVAEGATRDARSDLGTMSYMPPIMGQMIAGEVIRGLLGMR